jgi:progranulin
MSDDEGEKFYLDYWTFPPVGSANRPLEDSGKREDDDDDDDDDDEDGYSFVANSTVIGRAKPPLLLHSSHSSVIASNLLSRYIRFPIAPRSILEKRDFQCPSGTSNCASVNRPDSCCAEGQTCQLIEDTGLGNVGCCAAGEACSGSLSTCASGYTSCPNFPGGGCCIPGYACVNGGCLLSSTATVIVTPSSVVTPSSSTTTVVVSSPSSSAVVAAPPTTSPTSAPSASQSAAGTITTITSTATPPNTLVCSSGFRSCPASLGGGCCPTDRACGRDICPEQTSTATVAAPVRPTSGDPTPSDTSITGCPTGFYACSAFYQGGCCRFGRDCAPTSCPTSATATLLDDNGVTVIATTSSELSANSILTGACATGWSSCAASDGGGCCPTGYVCGSSCTATATVPGLQASQVGKLAPNTAIRGLGRGVMGFAICIALVVVVCVAA